MRFLANENFPGDAVVGLKAAGHDIVWVRTTAPGSKDKDILAWAEREARVLLTLTRVLVSLPGMLDCPHHLALCYSVYRCQRQLKSARSSPPGLMNELIGLGTSRSLNQGVSACVRLRHNNLLY